MRFLSEMWKRAFIKAAACGLLILAGSVPNAFGYTKPISYRKARLICSNPLDPNTCTLIPSAIVFKEQYHLSPHSWAITKAIDFLAAKGFTSESNLARKYLLPMLEGVTFNDVWGDADLAGGSVLDYYIPDKPGQDFGYGCVLGGAFFAPYKNCTTTSSFVDPNSGQTITIPGFDTQPFYLYGNAAEEAQFRFDYAKRIYLDSPIFGRWGDDPHDRDMAGGWVIDDIIGQDDPFNGRWAKGMVGIDTATSPGGTQSRFGTNETPANAMLDLFQNHTNVETVFPPPTDPTLTPAEIEALSNIHVPTDEVFSHAPEWLDDHFNNADDVEAYNGWDGHDNAVYASFTLDAGGHCGDQTDCAAPMVIRLPVNSKVHAFFNLGWAIHLLEDNTTPVHTIDDSVETFEVHNDIETMADAVLRDSNPVAIDPDANGETLVMNRLPALSKTDFGHLFDFPPPDHIITPPPPQMPFNCSTGVPNPSDSYRDTWWADGKPGSLTLQSGEGVAHGYTRSVSQISHAFIPYIECINTEDDHNWPSMGFFTASGLDNAIKATAGLIRRFIEDVDKTPPAVTIVQPTATNYPHSGTITLNYTAATDDESGVASADVATLDGNTTVGGHGLASGQAINLLTEMTTGNHTFKVTASDNAGNIASPSVTFSIIVTPASIIDDVNYYLSTGDITVNNEANSLLVKLKAAAAFRAAGDCKDANVAYQDFINELKAQSGKKVSKTSAAVMIADAQYLIAHCP